MRVLARRSMRGAWQVECSFRRDDARAISPPLDSEAPSVAMTRYLAVVMRMQRRLLRDPSRHDGPHPNQVAEPSMPPCRSCVKSTSTTAVTSGIRLSMDW